LGLLDLGGSRRGITFLQAWWRGWMRSSFFFFSVLVLMFLKEI